MNMKVQILAQTPDIEKIIAAAGRFCYSPAGVDEVLEGMTEEKATAFVNMLSELGHTSTIEHASFTFGIEGVSRTLLAQLTRHRIASFSVQSQRYVREKMFEYVIPPEIAHDPEASAEFAAAMEEDQRRYDRLTQILTEKHKKQILAEGKDEKTAAREATKRAIEDARFVLPNACTTKIMMTMNCRSLMNFFSLRCCSRAQWEIRRLAEEMYALVYAQAPHIFAKAGPGCVRGQCPEGKMSCGKAAAIREKYNQIRETAGKH